jgi:hypothetical protein
MLSAETLLDNQAVTTQVRGDYTLTAFIAGRGSQAPRTAWGQPLGGTIPPPAPPQREAAQG